MKICNACSTLNHAESESCVNCSWQGGFDYDPDRILAILAEIQQYVSNLLEQELSHQLPWRHVLSVRIKSLVFTIHRPSAAP